MKKYLVEFIGTFFLVLTICMTAVYGDLGNFAPIAIGSVLMVMIFAGGHISGAHYNPAVTVSLWLRGATPVSEVGPYIGAQLVGGLLAALVAGYFHPGAVASTMSPEMLPALLAEFLGTFALCYVILNVATAKGTENNSFYGLAIGFTVLACAYAFGGVSGGAFNPAVATGLSLAKAFAWGNIWIYLVANVLGGVVAAYTFKFVNGGE